MDDDNMRKRAKGCGDNSPKGVKNSIAPAFRLGIISISFQAGL